MKSLRFFFIVFFSICFFNLSFGQKLVPCKCEDAGNKKIGYCDSTSGKNKIECKFDSAFQFVNGMARVFIDNKYGFINIQGQLKIPADLDLAADFSEGFAAVKKDGKYFFLDQKNTNPFGKNYFFANPKLLAVMTERQLKQFGDPLSSFSNGLALVLDTSGKAGYINTKGSVVIEAKYLYGSSFGNSIAFVQESRNVPLKAIDKTGKVLFELPLNWTPEESFSYSTAIIRNRGNKSREYNVINTSGKMIFNESYNEIYRLKQGFLGIVKNLHSGIGTSSGQVMISPDTSKILAINDIDDAGNYSAFLYDDTKKDKLGDMVLLNKNFKQISRSYNFIMDFKDGFYQPYQRQVNDDLLFGLLSKEGKELLPTNYELIRYNSSDRLIFVKNSDGKEGLYDYNRKPILPEEYNNIDNWESVGKTKTMIINQKGLQGIVDKMGKAVTPLKYSSLTYEEYGSYSYYSVKIGDKEGVLNLAGKEIIPVEYESLYAGFEKGCNFFIATKNGKVGWIDKTGKIILPIIYSDGLSCPGKEGITWGKISDSSFVFINKMGQTVFGKKFQDASFFDDGIAFVKEKGKYGFINTKGGFVIPPSFDRISYLHEFVEDGTSLYAVVKGGKCGFMDKSAKQITGFNYDALGEGEYYEIMEGMIAVKQNNKWGFIDTAGKEVIAPIYDSASEFSNGKSQVTLNGETFNIDKKGNKIK